MLHKLEFPARVFSTAHADSRPPLLKVYLDDDERVHAFEKAWVGVVGEMSLDQMKFQKADSAYNWIHNESRLLNDNLRGNHWLGLNCHKLFRDLRCKF